jgi:hypothetical protein
MSDLHFEHKAWKSESVFQKDELTFFKNRLEEVVPRYTNQEVLAKAEQFQNQMIRHNEVVDTLIHDINQEEQNLIDYAKDHPVAINHVHFNDHTSLRSRIESQRKIYADFKGNFFRYLTETM